MKSISASLLALLLFVNVACAADPLESRRVQSPPDELPTCTIQRTATGIVVDGEADDADWQRATPIPFVSPWNDVEKEGNQATVARMLWDDDNLYIVYVCQDPYLDTEVTNTTDRSTKRTLSKSSPPRMRTMSAPTTATR